MKQYWFNNLGNLITYENTYCPGKPDKLFDSALDDYIDAGDGINVVYATQGGRNLIYSGNNMDYSMGGADIVGIGGQGFALTQAIDLYNYRQSLTTAKGQSYQALYLETDDILSKNLMNLSNTNPQSLASRILELEQEGYWVSGTRVFQIKQSDSRTLVGMDDNLRLGRNENGLFNKLNVAYETVGHSLGGHLAMILERIDSTHVTKTTVFNPPYFDPSTSHARTDDFFTHLSSLGISGIGNVFSNITSYQVDGDIIHNIGSLSGNQKLNIYDESERPLSEIPLFQAHRMPAITDALFVFDIFQKLSPSITIFQFNEIARSASMKSAATLETFLDSLRVFVLNMALNEENKTNH